MGSLACVVTQRVSRELPRIGCHQPHGGAQEKETPAVPFLHSQAHANVTEGMALSHQGHDRKLGKGPVQEPAHTACRPIARWCSGASQR